MSAMKVNKMVLLTTLVLTSMFLSCKKERKQTVTVVRDCTGTYLRLDGKDHQVCNLESVSPLSDGATVIATFKKISECNDSANDALTCEMHHENEGWVKVEKIKNIH